MSEFQVGDVVMLKDPTEYVYNGTSHAGYAERVGITTGTIIDFMHVDGNRLGIVEWDLTISATENKGWGIDLEALQPVPAPVTQEELEATFKSLGVNKSICWACGDLVDHAVGHVCTAADD